MEKKLKTIFERFGSDEPGEALKDRILSRIEKERIRVARRRLFVSAAGLFASLVAMVFSGYASGNSFLQSDFWSILNLVFSDIGIVSAHLGDFIASLAETFPVVDAVLLTIPVFTLLVSLSAYFKSKGESGERRGYYKYA
ncbi:MAG: EscU/YscU/HrcU family type III secretion system export apparatus switch protein [Candidatus Moranbacteria bacterium]|nr:EscU/YscU/HrcU family type III secretion system export apparatus switch protein [Candidatus Moranbacteria bacterium]